MIDMTNSWEILIKRAQEARQKASAPYSNFSVGAAIETDDGRIFTGCNIESSVYGLSICAERVALFKALSEGARKFSRIAIATAGNSPSFPCGACRQLLWDYAQKIEIISVCHDNRFESTTIERLYVNPFGSEDLK